jgi:hypothetical protein
MLGANTVELDNLLCSVQMSNVCVGLDIIKLK